MNLYNRASSTCEAADSGALPGATTAPDKGDNLTKRERHQRSADPQQEKELVEALFKLTLCIIIMVV